MKLLLVVDVEEHGDYYADVYRKDADDRFEGRYYLKPLPQKVEMDFNEYYEGMADGWNACIDEITGETE